MTAGRSSKRQHNKLAGVAGRVANDSPTGSIQNIPGKLVVIQAIKHRFRSRRLCLDSTDLIPVMIGSLQGLDSAYMPHRLETFELAPTLAGCQYSN